MNINVFIELPFKRKTTKTIYGRPREVSEREGQWFALGKRQCQDRFALSKLGSQSDLHRKVRAPRWLSVRLFLLERALS
jgi:hypothetical protein